MAHLRHLIVMIPGIGGSVLSSPDGTSAWDVTARGLGHVLVRPSALDLDRHPDLMPTSLIDTLTVLRPWFVVPGYDGMTHNLRTYFGAGIKVVDYRAGQVVPSDVDVLRVPYDFRESVVKAADVVGRAVTAAVGASGRQVIVLAHSLGGLVARYWIGPGAGWRHCRALITLGTPHRGAPRALDWLFNGVGLGCLRYPAATRVLRRWPSVYELLPQYPAVLVIEDGTLGAGVTVEPVDLPGHVVRRSGDPAVAGDVLRRASAAARVHEDIAAGWQSVQEDRKPALVPYFGRGHHTLSRATLAGRRVRVTKEEPEWRGNVDWRGDGTVPALSAIPAELSQRAELVQALPDKHGPMGSAVGMMQQLVTLQGDDIPIRGSDRPSRPWVGWDVDDLVVAGSEIEVGAQLHHGAEGLPQGTGSAATVTLANGDPSTGPGPTRHPMTPVEDGWRVVLPPPLTGVHDIHVQISDAWYGTAVHGSTQLAVLDGVQDGDEPQPEGADIEDDL
ncbi:MAG: esterase/lipase family protein [Pseudonocardiaceae bacterium]